MNTQLLHRKLLVKPGSKWLLWNAPEKYRKLNETVAGIEFTIKPGDKLDGIQIFATKHAQLADFMKEIYPFTEPHTILWVCYPKKGAGMDTDLGMMKDWEALNAYQWQPVASAAIDETWTALRFKPENQIKKSAVSNDAIRDNPYSQYIDVDTKTVKEPEDLLALLEQNEMAHAHFKQLSYTNKKEYVLWILSAKQEKTRTDRVLKTLKKLSAGKKNPTDK